MTRTITFTDEQLDVIDTLMNHGFECFLDDRISKEELLEGWDLTQEKIEEVFTLINGECFNDDVEEVAQCIVDTNGAYAECVDHLVETMGEDTTNEWYDEDGRIKHVVSDS